eukprot:4490457-Pyramimonas_sp.AAC.1
MSVSWVELAIDFTIVTGLSLVTPQESASDAKIVRMARYFSTAATRMSQLCKCTLAPRETHAEISALIPLGLRKAPGFKCRASFVARQHTMKVIYALALASTDRRGSLDVCPDWCSPPKPIWNVPCLKGDIAKTVRESDLSTRAMQSVASLAGRGTHTRNVVSVQKLRN